MPSLRTTPFAIPTHARRYEGRVAIVTGAAQGLGRVIARRLAEEGADVMVADIQEARAQHAAATLAAETGRRFVAIGGDLSREGVAETMVQRALDTFGHIDTLVNNAAALIRMKLIDFDEDLLQKAVDGNVWTTLRCCRAVLPHMIERRYGRIVNVGGEAWRTGMPYHTLLAGVGKGSMVGLTATLAGEVVQDGITVNCVSPGGLESEADGDPDPDANRSAGRDPRWTPPAVLADLMQMSLNRVATAGRLAHPTEVAAAVAFFGSPESSFTTGQHLGVSGGMAML